MRAVEYSEYGPPDVLHVIDVDKPTPKAKEVLVKIKATTVTATEAYFRRGSSYLTRIFTGGLLRPKLKRLGEEFAGVVEEVGPDVTEYTVGDKVFGTAGPDFGAYADYLCIPEAGVITSLPANVSFEQAAGSIDGFLTALPFLRDTGGIQEGHKVLIYGASGSVGAAAVQVARIMGARVHGVCSTGNLEMVRGLGAVKVFDYTKEDFTCSREQYDIIFDAVGKISFGACKRSLTRKGVFLEAGFSLSSMATVLRTAAWGEQRALIAATGLREPKLRKRDLVYLKSLLEDRLIAPVIDKTYPLSSLPEAHAYVDTGRKKGNVVITL